jgi:benzoyl-CoA reductase/2-hydroxyglutaryl-CoA dehydratase subunit BcrC/BadD/HgdB
MDNSAAALRLWNFLLTEEDRLHEARVAGKKIVGTMKDLGTVPVMVYAFGNMVAFYPDGAWWIPCIMEGQAGLLQIADRLGVDDSFCPVRAMLGAFVTKAHFPIPDMLTCSVGATCDDLSAIAQRLEGMGQEIVWWEIPHRRPPESDESGVFLPGGVVASQSQIDFVVTELSRIRQSLEACAGRALTDVELVDGIRWANRLRRILAELREVVFTAAASPLPALEMLIAEMLAIHFCSDRRESIAVLQDLLAEARTRVKDGVGILPEDAARIFWINPVADLRVMNLLEDVGGRVSGTEYLFTHALDPIPEDIPPIEALARSALADPMVGSPVERAKRICADIRRFGCEAVVFSRIPGASHCAMEGLVIGEQIRRRLGIPLVELEVAPITDSMEPTVRTRLEALVETTRERRKT